MTFRRFALSHPALFRLGVQREAVSAELVQGFAGSAQRALGGLHARITHLAENGQLGARSVSEAIWEFHAVCEGLATLELRCRMPPDEGERLWRDALGSLVAGWHPTWPFTDGPVHIQSNNSGFHPKLHSQFQRLR
jgi:hypothetical protein